MKVYKYVTHNYHPWIEKVECVKETSRCVWLKEKQFDRVWRMTKGSRIFNSWEDAHAQLIQEATHKVIAARLMLQQANGHLGNIKGLKPPTGESANNASTVLERSS